MSETMREIVSDREALARRAADIVTDRLAASSGIVAVALSGGSTPKRLFQLLAEPQWRDRIPWDRVHWFWGDERFVPPDHPDSNYRMTRLALFASVPVPPETIHPVPTTGLTVEEAAAAYEAALQRFYGAAELDPGRALFEITMLGLGEDGHTASLFPGTAALGEHRHWVTTVVGAKPEPRVTLTYPALNSSRLVLFLVAGAEKHAILNDLAAGSPYPAASIRPTGQLYWLLDRAAAGEA